MGPPGVLGIWGEWLFIFRDLGSTGNYLRGAGEQAHSFGDLGSPAKKQKNNAKASILFDFLRFLLLLGGGDSPPDPLISSKCIYFCITCTSRLTSGENVPINFFVVDLFNLKIFSLVIAYVGKPRLHQIAPFLSKFSRGSMPPDPPSTSRAVYCYSLPKHLQCNRLFR